VGAPPFFNRGGTPVAEAIEYPGLDALARRPARRPRSARAQDGEKALRVADVAGLPAEAVR